MNEAVNLNIKNSIENLLSSKKIAGASIAVTNKDKIIFSENFGVLNAETNSLYQSNQVMYRIASVTKIFAGLTIMKLATQNLLNLDTPIIKYIPYLKMSNEETQNNVTLRHLLSHTSGLPKEYTPDGERDEASLKASLIEKLPTLELISSLEEKKFCYSNWGIRLASLVAEEVSGARFSKLATDLIIKPLKMDLTTFDPLVALTYPTSLPHAYENGEFKVIHKINENATRYAAGGLFSNVEDLSKLARFILNDGKNDDGVQILNKEALNEIFKEQVSCNGSYYAYGLTSMLFNKNGIIAKGHLGSHPPYSTSLIIDKKSGVGITTLLNTFNDDLRLDIPFEILKTLY